MEEFWQENLKIRLQNLVPFLSALLLLLIFNIPAYPFVADSIRPYVGIICAYFWLVYRPYLFGIWSVYLLGFLEDVISNTPFGANIFSMMLLYVLTRHFY